MQKSKLILIAILHFCAAGSFSYGQGCSDAGVCTMNSFKPNNTDSTALLNHQFKIGGFFGAADNAVSVYGSYFEYNRQWSKKFGLDAKLTTLAQDGNGISTFGLSDIFINANYKANEKVKLTLGVKIPLANADKTHENLPLPMDYQSSLGTFDLVFGIGYEVRKIQIAAALQQPLSQNNNQFIASSYPVDAELRTFQSTHTFIRSGDVLLRVSYPINVTSKLKFTPSILPIYHLANDKYTDQFNVQQEIKGSQGLTLNGNAYIDYELTKKSNLQLNVAMPFIVRESRPDGLTRSFVVSIEYRMKF